jgi:hypothetical protein
MHQPPSTGVRDYYRRITSIDIGEIARELLNERITQSSERALLCDCPNHRSQSKRSLTIMLDKQGWYCFGCGVGGDVLQLVEFVRSGCVTKGRSGTMPDSHRDARDFLAERAGMPPLSHIGLSSGAIEAIERERHDSLRVFRALTSVADYYHRRLLLNSEVLDWFRQKYGIGDEMIDGLKIGYAENVPSTDSSGNRQNGVLHDLCKGSNAFTHAELLGTGAFRPSESGPRPFFNRRILFPYWSRGNVVFMIGRATPWTPPADWEKPKYKKLPVRDGEKHAHVAGCIRNDVLYNEDILVRRPDRVVITEGVTDCISLMEHGFPTVSPVTVQIRDADWGRILPKLAGAKTIYLCQDNEWSEAGLQGALRTADVLISHGITTRIATLPLGEKQERARQQLKNATAFRDSSGTVESGDSTENSANTGPMLSGLADQAKIDVNEYFAQGHTAADFETLLAAALTPLELSISYLSESTAESEMDRVLRPILSAVGRLSPVEQERHLRLVQSRLGKARVSISILRKQLRAIKGDIAARNNLVMFPGHGPRLQSEQNAATVLPRIQGNMRQLRDVVAECWAAIHRANRHDSGIFQDTPRIFRRGQHLVRLADRDSVMEIEVMDEASLIGILTQVADWYRATPNAVVEEFPCDTAARVMLSCPDPRLPQLNAIIRAPVFGSDGCLIAKPGYHVKDKVWMTDDSSLQLERLSNAPTSEELHSARDLICEELFGDFPFADASDRAHGVAALLLPFIRRMIDGPTPLHLIEAPTIGSGKGLLANVIAIVATGQECESRTLPKDEDEVRKMLTAELLKARPIILLDNVPGHRQLQSPSLASVLTAIRWTDRILGVSDMASLSNEALWLMTANNPNLDLELTRRTIRIRIDPRVDRPWMRKDFRHSDLPSWVKAHRNSLIHAILTLVAGWMAAERPVGEKRLGSFVAWSEIVGGVLNVAEIPGCRSRFWHSCCASSCARIL